MAVKMKVAGLTVDPSSNVPIIILQDEKDEKMLPIWIGILEASAIATVLEEIQLARPMTHDLFVSTLNELGVKIEKIVVNALEDNTYFARIHMRDRDGKQINIDARPSDSIALALRTDAEIFVEDQVLESAALLDKEVTKNWKKLEEDKWKDLLEKIDEDDLGKYRM